MGLATRETAAAASALVAYLTTVLPRTQRELRRWQPLPSEKVKNAEAVAVFATLAPRRERAAVVRAIVALQVAIDLRDVLEETGGDATDPRVAQLEARWRRELSRLPSSEIVRPLLERAVERCEGAQLLTHRAAREGPEALRLWAEDQQAPAGYRWWEVAAGASSSVAAHALIAAAADAGTTAARAAEIDDAYNPPMGALTVLLDDLVDREHDRAADEHSYLGYYADSAEAAERIGWIADRGRELVRSIPHAQRHESIFAGVGAYYLSDRRAQTPYAQPVRDRMLATLEPSTKILTAFISLRRRRRRRRSGQAGNPPGP